MYLGDGLRKNIIINFIIALLVFSTFLPLQTIRAPTWTGSETVYYDNELMIITHNHTTSFWVSWSFESSNPDINISVSFYIRIYFEMLQVYGYMGFEIGHGIGSASGIYHYEMLYPHEINVSIWFAHYDSTHSNQSTVLDVSVTTTLTDPLIIVTDEGSLALPTILKLVLVVVIPYVIIQKRRKVS